MKGRPLEDVVRIVDEHGGNPVRELPERILRERNAALIAADAIRVYRVIFDELQPDNQDAIEALARIYERTAQWEALNGVFQRQLDNAHGDVEESEIRAKMAHLASERLNDVDGAIEGWKRVLDLRGEDPEALRALAHLYEALGRWSELTDVLERHYDIADSDEST